MTIYLDFDNVLANTTLGVLNLYNMDYYKSVQLDDIKHYDFHDILNISSSQLWNYFNRVWSNIHELYPIEYSSDHRVNDLIRNGYKVEVVTGCGKKIVEDWLKNWEFPKLKVTYVKNGADKIGKKGDILVDDNPKHLEYAANTDRFPIVYDRPWNRDFDYGVMDRVNSFADLGPKIEQIESYISQSSKF